MHLVPLPLTYCDTYVFLDVLKKVDDIRPTTYCYKVGTPPVESDDEEEASYQKEYF